MMMGNVLAVAMAAALVTMAQTAVAQDDPFAPEPYGQDIDGWVFTQSAVVMGGIECRATLGQFSLSLFTQAAPMAGVNGSGVNDGVFKDQTIEIGGMSEKVSFVGAKGRISIMIDPYMMGEIAALRGYKWKTSSGKGGTVSLNGSARAALKNLKGCVAANGG